MMNAEDGKYDDLGAHWYKRSLFGTPLESNKPMAIVNYDNYLNGKWKETKQTIKGPGINYDKIATALSQREIPVELQGRVSQQQEKLHNATSRYEALRNKALNFQLSVEDEDLKKNRAAQQHSTGIRTYYSTGKPGVAQKYQYLGNVLDLQYANRNHQEPQEKQPIQQAPLKSPPQKPQQQQQQQQQTYREVTRDDLRGNNQNKQEVLFEKIDPRIADQYILEALERAQLQPTRSMSVRDLEVTNPYESESNGNGNIPTNIKHKFGSRLTDELLSEQSKVAQSLANITKPNRMQAARSSSPLKPTSNNGSKLSNNVPATSTNDPIEEVEKKTEEAVKQPLEDMSNFLRHTVSHGLPRKNMSYKQLVHSAFVNEQFLSDPNNYNSPNRRKKDWLGEWLYAAKNNQIIRSEYPITQSAPKYHKNIHHDFDADDSFYNINSAHLTRNNSTRELPKLRGVKKAPNTLAAKRIPKYKASSPLNKGADFEQHLRNMFESIKYK